MGIFQKLWFFSHFTAWKVKIWQFLTIFKIRLAENEQKIKIFKIPAHNFYIAPKSYPGVVLVFTFLGLEVILGLEK